MIPHFCWQGSGRKVSSRATGEDEVMPDGTHMDLRERVAALERMLAERDEALEY
jgi:hypothetical protein